ncbi:MAG: VWA domain-containing protein [Defluviitaleaceae bacterium]|nr:VWA domain-containing protein [Defluviitaleaceae bacterium]
MDRNLLLLDDLVNNPAARVPICLCLDTSGSMGRVVGGDIRETGRQEFRDGQMWNIVTGGVSAIDELMGGVKVFYDDIRNDEVAMYSAEICVITFGGNAPRLIEDFTTVDRQPNLPELVAHGETPMGEAVNLALDRLESRKQEYRDRGVDYYQPWLVLMTDGTPNGSPHDLQRAIARTQELVNNKKLTIFPVGIGDEADMNMLRNFSPKRSPLKLKGANFRQFFQWLSQSVSRTSQSMPGENISLDIEGIKGWAEL